MIQEKHKQEKQKQAKKKWERIPAEKGAPEIEQEDKRTKIRVKSST